MRGTVLLPLLQVYKVGSDYVESMPRTEVAVDQNMLKTVWTPA